MKLKAYITCIAFYVVVKFLCITKDEREALLEEQREFNKYAIRLLQTTYAYDHYILEIILISPVLPNFCRKLEMSFQWKNSLKI